TRSRSTGTTCGGTRPSWSARKSMPTTKPRVGCPAPVRARSPPRGHFRPPSPGQARPRRFIVQGSCSIMTEPIIEPTGTNPPADAPGSPTGRCRLHGGLPLTLPLTAADPVQATEAITDTVAAVFADLPGAVLAPTLYQISTPEPVPDGATAD